MYVPTHPRGKFHFGISLLASAIPSHIEAFTPKLPSGSWSKEKSVFSLTQYQFCSSLFKFKRANK